MAVLTSNETYTRWVIDPEEGETKFRVNGEIVEVDELKDKLDALPEEERTIEDMLLVPKEDARRINVVFRPLRAYDDFAMRDMMTESGVPAGSGERLLLKRAVVRWDFDVPWSEAILDQLNPGIVQQLRRWVSWGIAPLEQDPETGLPIPLEDTEKTPKENREQRRAKKTVASSSQKTSPAPDSPAPNHDEETS